MISEFSLLYKTILLFSIKNNLFETKGKFTISVINLYAC